MEFEQNGPTKKFIESVKSLVKSGKEKTYKDVAVKLDYNYSALNQIMNGSRNVPGHVYSKFTEMYKPVEVTELGGAYEIAIQNQAMVRVMLRAMAEILSKQRDEPVTKTLGDLEAAVRVEIRQVSGK